ncbi:hypothetical protein [Actinophytocola sp.]|uniref:hypothetical protein n=1 Tax=Actinophytocola sp. TaxID=1872138 RepID=UPI003D6A5F53
MALTPEQRSQRARLAALTRWAKENPAATAARGQAGLLARFEREVDPNNELAPAERTRRAECARKAHMARLALKSSRARAKGSELVRTPDGSRTREASIRARFAKIEGAA